MNLRQPIRVPSISLALSILLVLMLFAAALEGVQGTQKSSDELLLEIMDLHGQLVTNEAFLTQAKMLGAYLQAAQPQAESKRTEIYRKVLDILTKIKEGEQKDKSVFIPGGCLLEIFKADSIETIPKLPVIRTYWERDLSYTGGFPVPDRFREIGRRSSYVARFSFYYEVKEPGDYGFTLLNKGKQGACKLTVGAVDIVKETHEPSSQGICNLMKGFHRVEFWFISKVQTTYAPPGVDVVAKTGSSFEVRVLIPKSLDAVPLTKDMMLLKAE